MFSSSVFIRLAKVITLPLSYVRIFFLEARALLGFWFRARLGSFQEKKIGEVFNLDLHIGVTPDFIQELRKLSLRTTQFLISNHNHLLLNRLPSPDPVAVVSQKSWEMLDEEMIRAFQTRYKAFLSTFSGFLISYTPAFVELVLKFGKPILVVAATRYEAPYTNRQSDWERLNAVLVDGVESGQVTLISNNKGDADYIRFFTGISPPVLPSLCSKTSRWSGRAGPRVVIARDPKLKQEVTSFTHGKYQPVDILGAPYRWENLLGCSEVFLVPQNVSTMTLFELATAGVPVAVPSRRWFRELKSNFRGVLDELTFSEIGGYEMPNFRKSPVDWQGEHYLDWWLDRADFYDPDLMPNVRVVDSFDELMLRDDTLECSTLEKQVRSRNSNLEATREAFMSSWASSVRR